MNRSFRFTEPEVYKPLPPPIVKITSDFSEEQKKEEEEKDKAELKIQESSRNTKFTEALLAPDNIRSNVAGTPVLKWVLLSLIRPDAYNSLCLNNTTCKDIFILKVRGAFYTKQDAQIYADQLVAKDPSFMIHMIPMYNWAYINDNFLSELDNKSGEEIDALTSQLTKMAMTNYLASQEEEMKQIRNRISETSKIYMEGIGRDVNDYLQPQPERPKEVTDFFFDALAAKEQENSKQISATSHETIILAQDNIGDLENLGSQTYAVVSYILPREYGKIQYNDHREINGLFIKIRGLFDSQEKAEECAFTLASMDGVIDVHILSSFKWCPLKDDDVEERRYVDSRIRDIMEGFKEQRADMSKDNQLRKLRAMQIAKLQKPVDEQSRVSFISNE